MLNKIGSYEVVDDNQLHLGFMFSSPLILKVHNGSREVYQQIPQLSYIAESNLIKDAAKNSGRKINFIRKVAT